MNYVIYDALTGEIRVQIRGELNPCDLAPDTEQFLVLDNPLSMEEMKGSMVDPASKELVPKTEIAYRLEGLTPVADSVTEFIIKNVPRGTVCEGDKIDDGELRITFDEPGVYTFELTNPLYSPTPITITVVEP